MEFSQDVSEKQKVYTTLVSIEGLYAVSNTQYSFDKNYICQGICPNGETVYEIV